MKTRKLRVLGLGVLGAFLFGACQAGGASPSAASSEPSTAASIPPSSSAEGQAQKGKKITFVSPLVGHPVWLQAKDGFEKAANELGMVPTWTGPVGVDIAANVQQIEAALASGADGIVTCALDPEAFSGVLDEAKAKGVPVVLTDCEAKSPDQRLAFVGTIGTTFGEQSGKKLSELTGGKANIIVMQGSLDAKIQNDILDGFKTGIGDQPGMTIVAREADNSDVATAISKFEALFQTYPDANVVYCIEASCAGAAATVVTERKLVGKVLIFGTDDVKETLDGIRNGTIQISAAQAFPKMGQLAAQYLADRFNGKAVPSVTDTGVVFITKDNIDTYLK